MWDPESSTYNIALSEQEVTASQTQNEFGCVTGLPGSPKFTRDGNNKWYFEVTIRQTRGGIFVGIVDSSFNIGLIKGTSGKGIGDFPGTWAIDSYSGSIGHNGKWKTYAQKLKRDNVVGVIMNMDEQTLSFSINGQTYGVAFPLPNNSVYFPAVTLKHKGTSITANFGDNIGRPFKYKPEGFISITHVSPEDMTQQEKKAYDTEIRNKSHSFLYKKLPEEMIQRIFSFLPIYDIGHICRTCKMFNRLASERSIWKRLLVDEIKIDSEQQDQVSLDFRTRCKIRCNWLSLRYEHKTEFWCTEKSINCLQFNDKYMVVGQEDKVVLYNLIDEGEDQIGVLGSYVGHDDFVYCLQFDDKKIVSGSGDETIRIWGLESGLLLQSLQDEHSRDVTCLQFSSKCNSNLLASGSKDKLLKLWDMETGDAVTTFAGHEGAVQCLQFIPEEKLLLSGSQDKTVKLWDPSSGKCVQTFEEHSSGVLSLQYYQGRDVFYSGSADYSIVLFDIKQRMGISTYKMSAAVTHLQLKNDLLLSGEGNIGTIKIWQPDEDKPIQEIKTAPFKCMDFDEKRLRVGGSKKIKVWDFYQFDQKHDYKFKREKFLARSKPAGK